MASTTTDDQPVRGLPTGHVIAYGHAFRAPDFGSYTAGDGGVVSSAADMARWLVVNTHGGVAPDGTRVVSTSGLEQLQRRARPEPAMRSAGPPAVRGRRRPGSSTAGAC